MDFPLAVQIKDYMQQNEQKRGPETPFLLILLLQLSKEGCGRPSTPFF
jgi:hypothetical protein